MPLKYDLRVARNVRLWDTQGHGSGLDHQVG